MSNWERLRASVQKMHGNASGAAGFALGIVLDEMTTIELAPPEYCGCGHEHLPGQVLCYICDLPVKALTMTDATAAALRPPMWECSQCARRLPGRKPEDGLCLDCVTSLHLNPGHPVKVPGCRICDTTPGTPSVIGLTVIHVGDQADDPMTGQIELRTDDPDAVWVLWADGVRNIVPLDHLAARPPAVT